MKPYEDVKFPTEQFVDHISNISAATVLFARQKVLHTILKEPTPVMRFAETPFDLNLQRLGQALTEDQRSRIVDFFRPLANDAAQFTEMRLQDGLNTLLQEAENAGWSAAKFVDAGEQYLLSAGITSTKPWLLETAYRTQTGIAWGAGQNLGDRDPAVDEILWGYEYLAIPKDDRKRWNHLALDHTRLPKDDGWWYDHEPGAWDYNCRCQKRYIFKKEPVGERQPPNAFTNPDTGRREAIGNGLGINMQSVTEYMEGVIGV